MKLNSILAGVLLGFAALSARPRPSSSSATWWPLTRPRARPPSSLPRKLAELTKGKVKVEVYANSALYKDKEEMEALQIGAVQMLAPSLAKFGPLGVKEFEAFDLPFIFDDTADLHKITQGPVGAAHAGQAGAQRHQGPGLLGQRFQVLFGQHPDQDPR